MYNRLYEYTEGATPEHRRHGVCSLILLVAAVVVAGALGLGLVFWALGFLFHVVGLLLRVALIVGVATLVWRRVTRGRSRKSDY